MNDVVGFVDFFFQEPAEYEEKAVKKHWRKAGALDKLETIRETVAAVEPFEHEALHDAYKAKAEEAGVGMGQFIHPTRLALTGKSVGPGLFELAELLGRETCLDRIARAIEYVQELGEAGQ